MACAASATYRWPPVRGRPLPVENYRGAVAKAIAAFGHTVSPDSDPSHRDNARPAVPIAIGRTTPCCPEWTSRRSAVGAIRGAVLYGGDGNDDLILEDVLESGC